MAPLSDNALGKAFADPVMGSQRCFRAILAAMSEPGSVHELTEAIEPPPGVAPAAALVVLTLADQETPVWLAPRYAGAAPFVRFHCGARIVDDGATAHFALLSGSDATPSIGSFNAGEERYPDCSATLIVACPALDGGAAVTLTGPGIRGARRIAPAGLRPGFWEEVAASNARYPLGVDFILAAGTRILAVPRSSQIAIEGEAR